MVTLLPSVMRRVEHESESDVTFNVTVKGSRKVVGKVFFRFRRWHPIWLFRRKSLYKAFDRLKQELSHANRTV